MKTILTLVILTILVFTCCTDNIDSRFDIDKYDAISMRVINNSPREFSYVMIFPCFNSPNESFLNVSPFDTTEYRAYQCGFVETVAEVTLKGDNTKLRFEPLDFVTPLDKGDYDCILSISDNQELKVQIKLSGN